MRHTPPIFAAALIGFWLVAMGWVWSHPVRRDRIEPTALHHRIDVNAADPATLQLLPGVGPQIAENIVEHRDRGHRFHRQADLEQVHQIGPFTADRIAPWVRFDPK